MAIGVYTISNRMSEEIKSEAVYTTGEAERVLKISNSTIKRLLKKGILRANKVGGQYRITGKELLRIISPSTERKAVQTYQKLKKKIKEKIKRW